MDQTRIGTFIAVLRKEKGLTQKELAEQIGISDKTVSKWETDASVPELGDRERDAGHSISVAAL